MNKQELIKALETRRNLNFSLCTDFNEGYNGGIGYALDLVKALDEPKAPEVVVPQWFADWIEDCPVKDKGQVVYDVWFNYENDYFTKEQDNWLQDNKELATRAILDGYEVEKEPLYYVKLLDGAVREYLSIYKPTGNIALTDLCDDDYKTKFTEAEIKAINPKYNYWEFRVPVEEDK